MNQELGQILNRLKKSRKISEEQLRDAGMSQFEIEKIMNNPSNVSMLTLAKYLTSLKMDFTDFFKVYDLANTPEFSFEESVKEMQSLYKNLGLEIPESSTISLRKNGLGQLSTKKKKTNA